jgi:hypothetical protein
VYVVKDRPEGAEVVFNVVVEVEVEVVFER